MWAHRHYYGGVFFWWPFRNFTRDINVGVTHEFKYKMNEFILNFPETLGLKRLSRLEARVFCISPLSLIYLFLVVYHQFFLFISLES